MKKTLIALAVAGLSFNAMAINLDADTDTTQKFARELKIASTGSELQKVEVKSAVGFSLSTDAYVRLNFTGDVTASAVVATSSDGAATPTVKTWTVADSGKGYVILKNDGTGVAATDVLTVTFTAKVADKNDVSVDYKLYETAGNAVGQTGSLKAKAGTLLKFASALKFDVKAASDLKKIDVTKGATSFVGVPVTETNLVSLGVTTDAAVLGANGLPVADLVVGGKWKVDGPFVIGTKVNAVDITKDNVGKQIEVAAGTVKYVNDDEKVMSEGAINAEWVADTATLSAFTFDTYKFDTVAKLVKNGDKAEVNLALNPNGAYSQYVRISNKSNMAGAVFVTVIADDGKSVNFPLSAIAGQPASLEAGASTVQMTLKDIYAAAEAKGLTLTGDKKIRLLVDAQVTEDGLSVQSYTLSKDGNSFATMEAF
ncbi:hypothetical protein ACET8Q_02985 [Aeromonas veronii]